jgi:hypothetical protein
MKKNIANDIVVFFRTMKISIWIGIAVSCILFFLVFQGYEYIDPEIDISIPKPSYQPGAVFGTSYISNGDVCTRALEYCRGGWYDLPMDSEEYVEGVIRHCCESYLRYISLFSLLMGVATFIGVPILVFLYRILSRSIQYSKIWIDENKTI